MVMFLAYRFKVCMDPTTEVGFTRLVVVVEGLEDYAGALIRICTKNENYIAQEVKEKWDHASGQCRAGVHPRYHLCVVHSDTGE